MVWYGMDVHYYSSIHRVRFLCAVSFFLCCCPAPFIIYVWGVRVNCYKRELRWLFDCTGGGVRDLLYMLERTSRISRLLPVICLRLRCGFLGYARVLLFRCYIQL